MKKNVQILTISYPGAIKSAVHGFSELFQISNHIIGYERFKYKVVEWDALPSKQGKSVDLLIVPPALGGEFFVNPDPRLLRWIRSQHRKGTLICSVCAGVFIVAATGILDGRRATTHWGLSERFAAMYPQINLDADKILIHEGDVLTAGGLMAWLDLGLEIVSLNAGNQVMRKLGRHLIVDTAPREQRYYKAFAPSFAHGDAEVIKAQKYIQTNFSKTLRISDLAGIVNTTERTFLRKFFKALSINPTEYIQRIRIQRACELVESTKKSFEQISYEVGYENVGAFRKVFFRVTGLKPLEFRGRFGQHALS